MKCTSLYILSLTLCLLLCSCGSDPAPNEVFLGSYTAQKFCNDPASFTSEITAGAEENEIIWVNAAGEEGAIDDLKGTVTGTSITLEKKSIGGGLDMSATGSLLDNGRIEMTTTVFIGTIEVLCDIDFNPQ